MNMGYFIFAVVISVFCLSIIVSFFIEELRERERTRRQRREQSR